MVWGSIIAWYLFLAGVSAGAFLTSVYVEHVYPNRDKFLLVSRLVALCSLGIGLILLIVDATGSHHNPMALFYLLMGMKTSVMSWGVVILSGAAIVQALYVLAGLMRDKTNGFTTLFAKLKPALEKIGIVFCIGLAAYTGLLIGVIKTVPLWNNALLPVLFTVSALSAGAAATQFFGGIFAGSETQGQTGVTKIHCGLIFIELALVFIMLYIVSSGNASGAASVNMLLTGTYAALFWGGLIVCGLLIPGVFELIELKGGAAKHPSLALIIGTEALVLIGGFLLRFLVVKAAVPIDFLGF